MSWRFKLAIALSVLIGVLGLILVAVWLWWALIDYQALNEAWTRFMDLSKTPGVSTQRLLAADAVQHAHRLNLATEIVAMTISALIAAVGGLGIIHCLTRAGREVH